MVTTTLVFSLTLLAVLQEAPRVPSGQPALEVSAAQADVADTPAGRRPTRRPQLVKPRRKVVEAPRLDSRPSLTPRSDAPRFSREGRHANTTAPSLTPRSDAPRAARDSGPFRPVRLRAATSKRETIVIRLSHVPAADTAETICEWIRVEQQLTDQTPVTVVASVITNRLVVSGLPEQLERIRSVIQELDQPVTQIHVKATIVELALSADTQSAAGRPADDAVRGDLDEVLDQLKKRGEVSVIAQSEIRTADNQAAFLQMGCRVPRVTGTRTSPQGHSNQLELENMGSILGITGRVTDDNSVTLEIDLERSHLGSEEEGTLLSSSNDGQDVRSPQVKTLTMQTTVSLRSGQAVLVGRSVHKTESGTGELLMLLEATIVADTQ